MPKHENVSCPFCGLLCDDISLQSSGQRLKVLANACVRARRRFEAPLAVGRSATVSGQPVSLEVAVAEAARVLRNAEAPLFAGLGTDAAGVRALVSLAGQCGALLHHQHGPALQRNNLVLQESGWIMTTLSEMRNRADLVLLVGTDASNAPRFHERVLYNHRAQFLPETDARRVIYLGEGLRPPGRPDARYRRPKVLRCEQKRLTECLAVVRALVAGNPLRVRRVAGLAVDELRKLAKQLMDARYGVIVWAPGEMNFPHSELAIQGLCELVKSLNQHTRCAGLSLGGDDGASTANSLCAWQTGYPLPVSFTRSMPQHDAHLHDSDALLRDGAVDSLLWVSSFSPDHKAPRTRYPTIALAHPDVVPPKRTEVYIPVATPGVDHRGQLFRTDGAVALPLKQLRQSPYPSVSSVVQQIAKQFVREAC